MRTQNKMNKSVLSLVIGLLVWSATGSACDNCSQGATFQELCASKFIQYGYSEGGVSFGQLCAPVASYPALSCVDSLLRNQYSNISQDLINGCTWTTECGETAVAALLNNGYSNITGALLKAVGSAHSQWQANCMANVFNAHYTNITADNIVGLCP